MLAYYTSLIKKEELGKKYYNLHNHHFGHWSTDNKTNLTIKQKLSEASKNLHQNSEYREKYLEGRKKLPPRSEEAKRKTATANTGKKRTEETKRKISESNKGKVLGPLSDEHRKKVSESLKGNKNPFYGKKHKKETKQKISNSKKGNIPGNKGKFGKENPQSRVYEITDPLGNTYIIKGLVDFCRKNNLLYQAMGQVALGKLKQHKKYKCRRL